MTQISNPVTDQGGLHYFGTISASISHEIKNCLAIINENAGLAEDLLAMADRTGKNLEPERLAQVTKRITGQVQRANTIIQKMNKFSHSVDLPEQFNDLCRVVTLVCDLGSRICANRKIEIKIGFPDQPVTVWGQMFSLLDLVWFVTDNIMETMETDSILELQISKVHDQARIRFSSNVKLESTQLEILAQGPGKALAEKTLARLVPDKSGNGADLYLPGTCDIQSK